MPSLSGSTTAVIALSPTLPRGSKSGKTRAVKGDTAETAALDWKQ